MMTDFNFGVNNPFKKDFRKLKNFKEPMMDDANKEPLFLRV